MWKWAAMRLLDKKPAGFFGCVLLRQRETDENSKVKHPFGVQYMYSGTQKNFLLQELGATSAKSQISWI